MKVLISALLCLTLVNYAFGINCYQCMPPKDCSDLGQAVDIKCGKPLQPNRETACMKKEVRDLDMNKINITRTCVVLNPADPDDHCKTNNPRVKLLNCDICKTDGCNGSTHLSLSTYAMIGAILPALFAKYLF